MNVIVKEFGKVLHNTRIFAKYQHQLKLQQRGNPLIDKNNTVRGFYYRNFIIIGNIEDYKRVFY